MRLTFSAYTVLKGGFDILRRKPHSFGLLAGMAALLLSGCSRSLSGLWPITKQTDASAAAKPTQFLGFDRNDYPGDATMAVLHRTFAFTGYWLTPPPEETANTWLGKRKLLIRQGWGFLVLANGKLDAEILAAQKIGIQPEELGRRDAATAVAAARHEDFPSHTILFLDQEEGGRMLPEQSAYILGWTEAVTLDNYRAGLYASGQPVPNGPGKQITTIEDVRQQVKVKGLQLHRPPTGTRHQRHAQPRRMAVRPVPPPPRDHPGLRRHLRSRRQLQRPRLPHPLHRPRRRQQRRPLPRPLKRPLFLFSAKGAVISQPRAKPWIETSVRSKG
jgi:hypothetical protein